MPVLRELISRFSFETDKKSVANYNKTINGMTNSAKRLGSVLGVSLGAGALLKFGTSALVATQNLKVVAGQDFSSLQSRLKNLRAELDSVREGAGDIIREKDFNVIATSFIKNFGKSEESINKLFGLLKSASIQADVTGKSVADIFTGFQAAIVSGDFGELIGLGGLQLGDVQLAEDLLSRIDPATIGKREIKQLRANKLAEMLNRVAPVLENQLRATDQEFLDLQETTKEFNQNVDKLSEDVVKGGIGLTNEVFRLIKTIPENIEKIDRTGVPEGEVGRLENIFGVFTESGRERLKQRVSGKPTTINMQTTNNFNGMTNEKDIAEQIDKSNKKMIDDASNQIIRSEQE